MPSLPIMQTDNEDMHLMQTRWSSILNPMLINPALQGTVLKNVNLVSGTNAVNHKLGRPLQGWVIVRQRALASIFDTQDSNSQAALTLQLTSNANVQVDIYVF